MKVRLLDVQGITAGESEMEDRPEIVASPVNPLAPEKIVHPSHKAALRRPTSWQDDTEDGVC